MVSLFSIKGWLKEEPLSINEAEATHWWQKLLGFLILKDGLISEGTTSSSRVEYFSAKMQKNTAKMQLIKHYTGGNDTVQFFLVLIQTQ